MFKISVKLLCVCKWYLQHNWEPETLQMKKKKKNQVATKNSASDAKNKKKKK